jgi:hypothetical protein
MKDCLIDRILRRIAKLEMAVGLQREDESSLNYKEIKNKEKCSTSCNKNELAQLFYFLMDEKLFFFDQSDSKKNRAKMQLFIAENFTYKNIENIQKPIDTISRQFSECKGFVYKEKQIMFLEKLIARMQERRKRIEIW